MARRRHFENFDRVRARRERERQELTLKDLSERCEQAGERIHTSILSRWENGEYGPTKPRLKVLARALNIEADELLTPLDGIRQESAR